MQTVFFQRRPRGVVLAVKDGKTVYPTAFGKAGLELGADMDPGNIFRIGSITKQFTACAILRLAEAGKLSLQDKKEILPYAPDKFFAKEIDAPIVFDIDEHGHVIGLTKYRTVKCRRSGFNELSLIL
ncbi:serine hydrolase [Chitinophaga agrisoli]|uniref:serine hydrolase n=1 Tax=Chitinophaga agrisoli TaxID=2607653 RepID=UPI001BC94435|nr:serine hydrolase domain-containing protein [Chitinophaga agrisoli]